MTPGNRLTLVLSLPTLAYSDCVMFYQTCQWFMDLAMNNAGQDLSV